MRWQRAIRSTSQRLRSRKSKFFFPFSPRREKERSKDKQKECLPKQWEEKNVCELMRGNEY